MTLSRIVLALAAGLAAASVVTAARLLAHAHHCRPLAAHQHYVVPTAEMCR